MLHLLHQGPVVQSNCAVGSSYQSSMDHCRPLWSCSRHPINPKKVLVQLVCKSRSPIYYSITVSCYRIYWLSNIFIFSAKREKTFHLFNFSLFILLIVSHFKKNPPCGSVHFSFAVNKLKETNRSMYYLQSTAGMPLQYFRFILSFQFNGNSSHLIAMASLHFTKTTW